MSKTVLVTGGAGFIGSHLCEALLEQGSRVIAIDNLYSGSKDSIEHLITHKSFSFREEDIEDVISLDEDIHEIYNLACPASPLWYQKNPVKTVRTNVLGMANILELARQKNAVVLQASTSEVYGDPLEHPQKESYRGNVNTLGPRACYDEGKRCAETLCMDYHRQYGVAVRIVRIFNTYGPRMARNDGRVVSNFVVQALSGDPITVYGDGRQSRSFQYISDLISGLVAMMKQNGFVGPVNIGNPHEFTIGELAQLVIQHTNSKSSIVYKPLPEDDPRERQPDISLAKVKLEWSPKISLEEGLVKTIAYFRSVL